MENVNWQEVLPRLGINRRYLTKRHGPCPFCGGKDRFRFDNKEGRGTFYCNRCGPGDGVGLVALVNGCDRGNAFRLIIDQSTVVPIRPRIVDRIEAPTRNEIRSKLQKLWEEAIPVSAGDPVWLYLHKRVPGLDGDIPNPGVVRYHPSLIYWKQKALPSGRERYVNVGSFPAMIAKIRNADGAPVNIHRTYLSLDGCKASLGGLDIRKMMRPVSRFTGGGIHLFEDFAKTGRLGVGEGIETMLAVRAASGHQLPVWACVSDGGLRKFVVPDWVSVLHIFADHDAPDAKGRRAGQDAAEALRRRVLRNVKKAVLHLPDREGDDFLDQWMRIAAA